MQEEDITRQQLAILNEDQETHVLALRALFYEADSTLERQAVLNQSLALLAALHKHITLRREALDLLAFQITQLQEIAQRQHALLRAWPTISAASRKATRLTSSAPPHQQAE